MRSWQSVDRTAAREVHLVELTMLEEHNYSAVLGYLHAAIRTGPQLDGALDVHKHIGRTLVSEFDTMLADLLASMHDPAMVTFTIYFWNRTQSVQIARQIHERWPGCVVVFGGNDVTNQQDDLFVEAPFADVLVHGEGELRSAVRI